MPALADVILNDGAGTPVAQTFIPLGPSRLAPTVQRWKKNTNNSGLNDESIPTFSLDLAEPPPLNKSNASDPKYYRVKAKGVVPFMAMDAVTVCTHKYRLEADIDNRGNSTDRAHLYVYMKNLAAHATFQSYVKDLIPSY